MLKRLESHVQISHGSRCTRTAHRSLLDLAKSAKRVVLFPRPSASEGRGTEKRGEGRRGTLPRSIFIHFARGEGLEGGEG